MEDNFGLAIEWSLRLVSAALIVVTGWVLSNWVSQQIQSFKKLDKTLAGFLGGFAKYAIMGVAAITILGQFGVQTASLLALLGAAGLAVGFALQGTLSNVAAGTMLLVLRPFRVGDEITAGKVSGIVRTLGLFGTELSTGDNVYIFVPNSMIWNSDIWNFSRNGSRRHEINFNLGYNHDVGKVVQIIENALSKDERIIGDTEGKKPQILTMAMNDLGLAMTVRFWCQPQDSGTIKPDVIRTIKEALFEEGIVPPQLPPALPSSGQPVTAAKKTA